MSSSSRSPLRINARRKQRPAVTLSSSRYHAERPDLILMAITSQVRSPPAFGETHVRDWQTARLLKPSVIKPVLATLEQRLVRKILGHLSQHDQHALHASAANLRACRGGGLRRRP